MEKFLRLPREWLSVTLEDTETLLQEARRNLHGHLWRSTLLLSFLPSVLAVRCSLTPWAVGVGLQSEATDCDVFWPKSVQGAAGVP